MPDFVLVFSFTYRTAGDKNLTSSLVVKRPG